MEIFIIIGWWINILLCCALADRLEAEEAFLVALLFGPVATVLVLFDLWTRYKVSEGKCILKHRYEKNWSSEEQKHKLRMRGARVPVSMGGVDRYKCTDCGFERTVSWSAF